MPRSTFTLALIILTVSIFTAGPPVYGKAPGTKDPSVITLERIFSTKEFEVKRFGPARWLENKPGYTTVEPSKTIKNGQDIVYYHPKTGKRHLMVPAEKLIKGTDKKPLEIEDYNWSPNGKQLLIFTNTSRVWRDNTRGDYWVLDLRTGNLWQIGGDAEKGHVMFATFSPGNTRVAYVYKNNIYVQRLASNPAERTIIQITKDGSQHIVNGTFDWVYEEEFGLQNGYRWSPDGKHIAYWQLDTKGIRTFYMLNRTDTLYPKLISIPYPKVGTTNSAARVGIVSATGGSTQWINVPGDPRQHYIAWMQWAANSREIVFQRLNRLQNTLHVTLGDIKTGKSTIILQEKDNTWVDVVEDFKWLEKGKKFSWVSERDGWRHVYIVSRSGKQIKPVTPGNYDVIQVLKVDHKRGWLYFIASPKNPTQRFLYRTKLNGKGKPVRLTPANATGSHSYTLSENAKWAFHTFSDFQTPPQTHLIRLPKHKTARVMEDNKELRARVAKLKRTPVEFFQVPIGNDVKLHAWCMKPYDFDPSKKYPVLFYVYGEPAGQTVFDRWRGKNKNYLWHLMLTQQGYIVISIDNRGTPLPLGRQWRKCVYGEIGVLASADQAAATKTILKTRPYIDPNRVGIWGHSGGGSMTLNALFRHPNLYHTGMSIAPVPDQTLYDTIYQERYMGLPKTNPKGYKNGSPIYFAKNLKGNLLLIHGTGDDNVHYQGTERLIKKLIELNKHFTMMTYPNRAHSIKYGKNTTRHLHQLLTNYLKQHLPPTKR